MLVLWMMFENTTHYLNVETRLLLAPPTKICGYVPGAVCYVSHRQT